MSPDDVFISHSSKDDDFVKELREALESQGIKVWVDSRNLRGGSKLAPEIDEAIEQARQLIVVLSPNTINSPWVRKEIDKAVEVEKQRRDEGYRVIPLLLPGIEPSALQLWFAEEPVGVRVEIKTGGLSEAMPAILAALGERLPTDREPPKTVAPQRVEELILELSDPKVVAFDGKRRATATAKLVYEPADKSIREVESKTIHLHRAARSDRSRRHALVSGRVLPLADRRIQRASRAHRNATAKMGTGFIQCRVSATGCSRSSQRMATSRC